MYIESDELYRIAKREREIFPEGCWVEYVGTEREFSLLKEGERGRVLSVDNSANLFVAWENGRKSVLIYGVDYWKRVAKARYPNEK